MRSGTFERKYAGLISSFLLPVALLLVASRYNSTDVSLFRSPISYYIPFPLFNLIHSLFAFHLSPLHSPVLSLPILSLTSLLANVSSESGISFPV